MSTFTAGLWAFAARRLAGWAEFFQELSGADREQVELPSVETEPAESGPPADWLARLDSGGPPAHWLDLLRNSDPEWIEGSSALPPAESPAPAASFEAAATEAADAPRAAPSLPGRHVDDDSPEGPADVDSALPAEPEPDGRMKGPDEASAPTVEPQGVVPPRPAISARPVRQNLSFETPPTPARTGSPPLAAQGPPSVRTGAGQRPRVEPERRAVLIATPTAARPASLAQHSERRMEAKMDAAPAPLIERESPVAEQETPAAPIAAAPWPAAAPRQPVPPDEAITPSPISADPWPAVVPPNEATAPARVIALQAHRPVRDATPEAQRPEWDIAAPIRAAADAPPAIETRWPTLPEESSGPPEDWAMSWRAWERRRRLDREQRGT